MRSRLSFPARTAAGIATLALLSGCNGLPEAIGGTASADPAGSAAPATPPALTLNASGDAVTVDTAVVATATGGSLTSAVLKARTGETAGATIKGTVAPDGTWTAARLLEPATSYEVVAQVTNAAGVAVPVTATFSTQSLEGHQVFPSVAPLRGETVGIGMPVIVAFDAPVDDKATFEKRMHVTSTPAQPGSWYWLSDREAHWRPTAYWTPGTDVKVKLDLNSIPAGNGFYGQEDREIDFKIGDAHIYKVNARTHQMQVYSNGKLLRTIPVTTGQPGFTTRSGTKVIVEKARFHTMDSETTGIGKDDPRYYRVEDVEYAMRLTYSGEFIHAAPWSVASQGRANVSHGCTGMSTANAGWLYNMSRRGDVVETTGTDVQMTLTNGYGDWNASPATWAAGSAL